MSYFFLPYLYFFNAIAFVYLLIFILYKNPKSWVNRSCAAFLFCYFVWSLGTFLMSTDWFSREQIRLINNITSFGWISFSSFLLIFAAFFAGRKKLTSSPWFYVVAFTPALFFIYAHWQEKLLTNYKWTNFGWSPTWASNNIALAFVIYYSIFSLSAFFILLRERKKTKSSLKRKQLSIMVVAGLLTFLGGTLFDIVLPRFQVGYFSFLGDSVTLFWALGLVFAIVRYKFLDVTPALAAENIISTMSDVMVLTSMSGRIKSVNKATLTLLKYSESELLGSSIKNLFTKKEEARKIISQAKAGKITKNQELKLRAKDKKGIPVIFSTTILRNEANDPVGIVCLARDIIELKNVQEKLKQKINELKASEKSISEAHNDLTLLEKELKGEHNRISAIIANFSDPIVFVDNSGLLKLFNPAAQKILKIDKKDMNTKISSTNNFSLDNFAKVFACSFEVKTGEETQFVAEGEEEFKVQHKGQTLTFKVSTNKVVDRGYFLGTMKIFTNLTREKEIDKLKSEFITIAAHQLRTPLAAIKWVFKLVLDEEAGKINEEQKQYLNKGYQSNERIINLVNDMLDVSRIEEGRFGYSFAKENFLETLEEVLDNLKGQVKEREINLDVKTPKEVPLMTLDRSKITLVLQNLLENAVKYTPNNGTVKVKVEVGKNNLKVTIKDNGVGIPEEAQKKIFSKFFRAQNVMRMQTEGSGLGLFIVKNIIQKHGGKISFNSTEGKGSEFVFQLPLNNK
jgi:PAS domain S-box-containing protein